MSAIHVTGTRSGTVLIRKKRFLEKVPFSKSTLHAKLDRRSRYYDASMPRPFYMLASRIPLWDEAAVDAWLVNLASGEGGAK